MSTMVVATKWQLWISMLGVAGLSAMVFFAHHVKRNIQPVVAVVPAMTAAELWESEHSGVDVVATRCAWRVYWNGPASQSDFPAQVAVLQHISAMRVSGLILSPDHPLALTTLVRRFEKGRIPTVLLSRALNLPPSHDLGMVLNDEAEGGKSAATFIGNRLHGAGSVAVLGLDYNSSGAIERYTSFLQEITLSFPQVRLVEAPPGLRSPGEAEQQIEDLLAKFPDLSAIVSLSLMETEAASTVLQTLQPTKHVSIVGFDQGLDLMYELREGHIDAIVAQNTYEMGVQAMTMIVQSRLGRPMKTETIAPMLITRENIDSMEAQKILAIRPGGTR